MQPRVVPSPHTYCTSPRSRSPKRLHSPSLVRRRKKESFNQVVVHDFSHPAILQLLTAMLMWGEEAMHACPRCQSERLIKNGSAAGKPKKQCTQGAYQFTRTTPRGKPITTKINALLWSLSGMAMHRIAFSCGSRPNRSSTGFAHVPRHTMRSRTPRGNSLSWNAMRCGITSRKSDRSSGSGKR